MGILGAVRIGVSLGLFVGAVPECLEAGRKVERLTALEERWSARRQDVELIEAIAILSI